MTVTGDYDGVKYYTSTTYVNLTNDESLPVQYRVHNGSSWSSWAVFNEDIELLFSGTYTIEFYSKDEAGNESTYGYERIKLDIPPDENTVYVIRNGEVVTYYDSNTPILLPDSYTEKDAEIRAVWVATVGNIDIKQHINEQDYKNAIITMLTNIEANNFNTIFFQVRPMNDAFYDSDYAPWSRYLTGTEGTDPGWDVLEFIIEEAHKRGIEVHAWMNPYRVSTGTDSKETQLSFLHDDNFAKQNPELVLQDSSGKLILNPGEPRVQAYIKNVIREIMTNYDIDGIHFDDYFYSYNGMDDSQDSASYDKYKESGETLHDWRRRNIDELVEDIYTIVESHNQNNDTHIKWGISPFGIWSSTEDGGSNTSPYTLESYADQYADTKKWVEEGWVHYILPQLYWEFDHSAAPYADLVDWWAQLCEDNDVDLIIGHGFYRYAEESWDDSNELLEQLRYNTKYDSIIGSSFFSYKTLLSSNQNVIEAVERLNENYWTEYATFPWESDVVKEDPITCETGQTLVDGECIDDPITCEVGQVLMDGECIDEPVTCTVDQTLIDNECVNNSDLCEDNENYVDGECVTESNLIRNIIITISSVIVIGGGAFFFIFRRV